MAPSAVVGPRLHRGGHRAGRPRGVVLGVPYCLSRGRYDRRARQMAKASSHGAWPSRPVGEADSRR